MPTIESFTDVAQWVRKQYHKRKKNSKDSSLFVKIEEEAFALWGHDFGYKNQHDFKSELTSLINKLRKESERDSEQEEILNDLNKKHKPSLEGSSCFSFTFFQINNLQLDADSYL